MAIEPVRMQRLAPDLDGFALLAQSACFQEIDPLSLQIIREFRFHAVNHIRWDHEEGSLYGTPMNLNDHHSWIAQEVRDVLEYGDGGHYSGLRVLFGFAVARSGIDPRSVKYEVEWGPA